MGHVNNRNLRVSALLLVALLSPSVSGCAVAAGALVGTAIKKTSNERVSAREANCVKIHEINTEREKAGLVLMDTAEFCRK